MADKKKFKPAPPRLDSVLASSDALIAQSQADLDRLLGKAGASEKAKAGTRPAPQLTRGLRKPENRFTESLRANYPDVYERSRPGTMTMDSPSLNRATDPKRPAPFAPKGAQDALMSDIITTTLLGGIPALGAMKGAGLVKGLLPEAMVAARPMLSGALQGAGAVVGGMAAGKAQDVGLRAALGDKEYGKIQGQQAKFLEDQPLLASVLGNLGGAPLSRPSLTASAAERLIAGGMGTGVSAAQDILAGQPIDWARGFAQGGINAAFAGPNTRLGNAVEGAGTRLGIGMRQAPRFVDPNNWSPRAQDALTAPMWSMMGLGTGGGGGRSKAQNAAIAINSGGTKKPPIPSYETPPPVSDPVLSASEPKSEKLAKDVLDSMRQNEETAILLGYDRARFGWYAPRHPDSIVPKLFVQGGIDFPMNSQYGDFSATASTGNFTSKQLKAIKDGARTAFIGAGSKEQMVSSPQFRDAWFWENIDEIVGGASQKGPRNPNASFANFHAGIRDALTEASQKKAGPIAARIKKATGAALTKEEFDDLSKRKGISMPSDITTPTQLKEWLDNLSFTDAGNLMLALGRADRVQKFGLVHWSDVGAGYVEPSLASTAKTPAQTLLGVSGFDRKTPMEFSLSGSLPQHGAYDRNVLGRGLFKFPTAGASAELLFTDTAGNIKNSASGAPLTDKGNWKSAWNPTINGVRQIPMTEAETSRLFKAAQSGRPFTNEAKYGKTNVRTLSDPADLAFAASTPESRARQSELLNYLSEGLLREPAGIYAINLGGTSADRGGGRGGYNLRGSGTGALPVGGAVYPGEGLTDAAGLGTGATNPNLVDLGNQTVGFPSSMAGNVPRPLRRGANGVLEVSEPGAAWTDAAGMPSAQGVKDALSPKDFDWRHRYTSPLSLRDASGKTLRVGSYERLGGDAGAQASDLLRAHQIAAEKGDWQTRQGLSAQIERLSADIRDGKGTPGNMPLPGLAEEIYRHLDDISGKPKPYEQAFGRLLGGDASDGYLRTRALAGKLTGFNSVAKLRFSPRSALVNRLQPLETLWPYISTKDYLALLVKADSPAEWDRLEKLGVLDGPNKLEEGGQAQAPTTAGRLKRAISNPFGAASSANRVMGYLFGEMDAKRKGITDPDQVHANGLAWAEMVEFDNSVYNAPPVLRDTLAKVLLQFKGFTVKSLENLFAEGGIMRGDVPSGGKFQPASERAGRILKWGTQKALTGGVKSLTEWSVIAPVAAYVALRGKLEEDGMDQDEADKWASSVILGAPTLALPGAPHLLGVDVSSSVGVLSPPFGETTQEQLMSFAGGPTLGTGIALKDGISDVMGGANPVQAGYDTLRKLSPYPRQVEGALGVAGSLTGRPQSIMTRGGERKPQTLSESLLRAGGFTPARQAAGYIDKEAVQGLQNELAKLRYANWLSQSSSQEIAENGFKERLRIEREAKQEKDLVALKRNLESERRSSPRRALTPPVQLTLPRRVQ